MIRKTKLIPTLTIILIMVFTLTSCGLLETRPEQPIQGSPEPRPTDAPPEPAPTDPPPDPAPTDPPPQPTEAPVEPEPTDAPTEGEDESAGEGDWVKLILVLGVIFLIIVVIVLLAQRGGGKSNSEQQPAQSDTAPVTVEDHLNNANPLVAELYKRFNEIVQTVGVVSVVPTETRIDFQARMIFSSVEFREDSLLLNLVMPHRIDSVRISRVDTYSETRYANYISITSLDDYDAEFTAWLQEAYNLGAG